MTIEINYEGVKNLKSMASMQAGYLGKCDTFADGDCGPAPFETGLLFELFAGEYRTAHQTMTESLEKAKAAAARVGTTIQNNMDTYKKKDIQSSTSLKSIEGEIDTQAAQYTAPREMPPAVPMPLWVKNSLYGTNSVADADWAVNMYNYGVYRPRHAYPKDLNNPWSGPSDIVEGVTNTIDAANSTMSAVDGYSDKSKYEQWIKKHKG